MGNTNYITAFSGASAHVLEKPTIEDMESKEIFFNDCKDKCDTNESCNGFIFEKNDKMCKFFVTTSSPYYNSNERAVLKKCTEYSKTEGTKISNFNSISEIPETDRVPEQNASLEDVSLLLTKVPSNLSKDPKTGNYC